MCSAKFKSSPIDLCITHQAKPIKSFFLVKNHLIYLSQNNPTEKPFQSYQNPCTQSVLKFAKNEISRPNWFLYEMKAKYPEPAVV
jgi:hypothetical protein